MPPDSPPDTFHARLERVFRNANAPGSLATPLTTSPETAAEMAAKYFAAFLRDQAAMMWRHHEYDGAVTARRLADQIDPLGPVMAAPAAGGIS